MKLFTKAGIVIAAILFLLAIISSVYFWYQANHKPTLTQTEYVTVEKIKEVEKIKRVEVPVEKIITIEKEVVVEKLKLPDWFRDDEDKQAIATAVVPSYEGKTNVVGVINTKTGIGEIIAKQEPLGFFGLLNDRELYGKIGYSTKQSIETVVGVEWKFVRIERLKIGVFTEASGSFNNDSTVNNDLKAVAGVIVSF